QVDGSTTRRHGGNGLGLAISRELAVRMGARIGCDSAVGAGSTFWIELVLPKGGPVAGGDDDFGLPARARVLLVEPGRTHGRVLPGQLCNAGMDTAVARSTREALEQLRRAESEGNPYSLVLVERDLEDSDGVTLVRQIRSEPAFSGLKVVLLAPASRLLQVTEARELQLQSFLVKPVRESQLRQCLARVLRAPARSGARGLEFLGDSMRAGAASRLRVLLVEDNQINQKVGIRHLERLGHDCDVAQNGQHALEMLALQRYDLVLMDCQMPELDGYETTRRIRRGAVAGVYTD